MSAAWVSPGPTRSDRAVDRRKQRHCSQTVCFTGSRTGASRLLSTLEPEKKSGATTQRLFLGAFVFAAGSSAEASRCMRVESLCRSLTAVWWLSMQRQEKFFGLLSRYRKKTHKITASRWHRE